MSGARAMPVSVRAILRLAGAMRRARHRTAIVVRRPENNGESMNRSRGSYIGIVAAIACVVAAASGTPALAQEAADAWKPEIVESTNFRAVKNMRGPSAGLRSRQSEAQRVVERFTLAGPDELRYSVTMDDAETYTAPWTAAFPFNRDDEYLQFEYACHEGNYSVPNALGGARLEEAGR